MQTQPTPGRLAPSPSGVLVVDGYGVRLRVDRSRLIVADGIGRTRRVAQFPRAGSGIRRLVILGHTGSITFDALRWLADVGIRLIHLDPDGRLLATSGAYGRDDARLRRAQALMIDTPAGSDLARRLIAQKVAGQAHTLAGLAGLVPIGAETINAIREAAGRVHLAASRDELRLAEAQAAGAYWAAWSTLTLRFPTREGQQIPEAWRTFGTRSSEITGNPRLATNPANAILNYLYAVLEAEARLACLTVGLDPGLGVLHADLKARDSLALDVMEAVRPQVDAYVIQLLLRQVFRYRDFHETRQGACRLLEPLSHRLAETAPVWASALGPVVEQVARLIVERGNGGSGRQPTPLTGTNRSASRRPAADHYQHAETKPSHLPRRCQSCGTFAPSQTRRYCDECLPSANIAGRTEALELARARLADLRASGAKPGVGGEAALERGRKVAAHREANRLWEALHGRATDPRCFAVEVLPLLRGVRPSELASTTGLTRHYCAAVLRGEQVPHPRWWQVLTQAYGGRAEGTSPGTISESRLRPTQ